MAETSHDKPALTASLLGGPVCWIGAGKMGSAILAGALDRGLPHALVRVQEPTPHPDVSALLARHGLKAEASLAPGDPPAAILILAVKPQAMGEVLPAIAPLVAPQTLIVSIAAGKPIGFYEALLPAGTAIVRAMPNTPAAIGKGITVCCANAAVSLGQRAACAALLATVGAVDWIEDEDLMDAVTAVSGSGPAYVFNLVEAMAKAGVAAGLDEALAMKLARATVAGSGALMEASPDDAATLRRNVTSPGGTTAAALEVLMNDAAGLDDLMTRAILAAQKRGRELAGK